MQLTKEQQQIISHSGTHAKVSAVAGSGKTTTMVSRVKHLLAQGVPPGKLLILMFNKSARDSFAAKLEKLSRISHQKQKIPEVRTFHSLGLRLIKSFTKQGYLPHRVLQTEEFLAEKLAKSTIRLILEQGGGNEEWLSKENIENFITFIDLVKSDTQSAEKIFSNLNMEKRFDYFIHGFKLFEKQRKAQKIRFYADLIYEPVMAMLDNEKIGKWVGGHVDHIIVDEYQDINEVQQQLLRFIAGDKASVMVVGDVDQCIYEWRGAKPEYISSRFEHDFPKTVNYTLSYTFRYGHRLSLAANHLISNNRMRDRKMCLSFSGTPDSEIRCLEESNHHPLLPILENWKKEGRKLKDCAVLVRLYAMAVPVELALLEHMIPYHIEGHEPVFECREIMALCGFLQLCEGSLGQGDLQNGLQTIEAMLSNPHLGLKRDKISYIASRIAKNPAKSPDYIISATTSKMPYFLQEQLHKRAETWHKIIKLPVSGKAHEVLETIIETSDLFSFYHRISTRRATAVNRVKTCVAFLHFAKRMNLQVVPFLQKIEQLHDANTSSAMERLLITSIHRAKGLEWPLVIIPGLEDGAFPLLEEKQTPFDNLEDERRLFYVAMTRAINRVVFTHPFDAVFSRQKKAGNATFPPQADSKATPLASRFLYESNLRVSDLLGEAVHVEDTTISTKLKAQTSHIANCYLKAVDSPVSPFHTVPAPVGHYSINDLAEGVLVRSAFFGNGVVTQVLDRSSGKIRVLFNDHGEKVLMAEIARLLSV